MPSYSFNAPLIAGKKGDKGDKGDTGAGVATTNLAGGKNWFDKNNYLDNTQIASNGALNPASSGYRTSLLIPVTPGEVWTLSGMIATSAKRYRWVAADGTTLVSVGTSLFPQPNTLTAPPTAYYFQFTFKRGDDSGSTSWDNAQFEKGAVATSFEAYTAAVATIAGVPIRNAAKDVYTQAQTVSLINNTAKIPALEVLKNGNTLYIRTKYNDTQSCVHTMNLSNVNGIPTLTSVKIIGATETIVATGVGIHSFSDNTPPLQFKYMGNLGGSHGVETIKVTATAHGKTSSDVTGRYIDGAGIYFRITEIVDTNNLLVLSEPWAAPLETAIKQSITGNLTYVSGGVSTSNITVSAQATEQRWPSVKNITVTLRVDGNPITADGTYKCDLFEVVDTHDVIDPSAMTFTAPQVYNNASSLAALNVVYAFRQNASMQLDTTISVLRKHEVTNFGGLQVQKTTIAGSLTNRFIYMPNITGKVVGANTYNFVDKIDMSTDPPAAIYILPGDLTDITKPTDRQVQILTNASLVPQHGHAHGYDILAGGGKYAERTANTEVWYHSDANKSYPRAFAGQVADVGDVIYMTAYSNYFDPNINPNITSCYYITTGVNKILYIDVHQTLTNQFVKLTEELYGRAITVIDKSASFTLKTADKVMSPGITISVSGGYGYAILKLT